MSTLTPESALQRCLDAFNQANAREDARSDFSPEALARVNRAWRRAMPILSPDTIDAFIACVTHGLLYEVFPLAETSKLLYAAQVTLGLLRARREAARQQPKSDSKPAPTPTPLPLNQGDPSNPQPSCAPSMGTVSSSPWVGDHEPQPAAPQTPPTPLPQSRMAAKPQPAAPPAPRNQLDILLEQLYAGKLPAESPLTPCAAVLKAAPPTPSPLRQSTAPQAPKGENTLLRAAS
jgi:hypothetical protein